VNAENATVCLECKRDAADPKGTAYRFKKGPYCGASGDTQPMYACRFGKDAAAAAHIGREQEQ
jgi:hypothetical protein